MNELWRAYYERMALKRKPARDAWERLRELLVNLECRVEQLAVVGQPGGGKEQQARLLAEHEAFLDDGHVVLEGVFLLSTPGLAKELEAVTITGQRLVGREDWSLVSQERLERAKGDYEELRQKLGEAVNQALALPGHIKVEGLEPQQPSFFVGGGLSPSLRRRPEAS